MRRFFAVLAITLLMSISGRSTFGQSFGIELLNNLMPASGAMGGASIATPQDLQSAIYGNPASLTQFYGTQFGMSGVWVEGTINSSVAAPQPAFGVTPFTNAKSDAQGVAAGNVGITQDFSAFGLPVTFGAGLMAGSGAGIDLRHVPESNGTHVNIAALDIVSSVGVDLTDRFSVGASILLSNMTLDGPFVGTTGSSADYALRGVLGIDYELTADTTVGAFWKTKAAYTFENLFQAAPGVFLDVAVDRPEIAGIGIANSSLMNGKLLLAFDAVYLMYTDTALFGAVFRDQWALQFGSQYSVNDRVRLRMGYAWNENPMRDSVGNNAGGILPPGGADQIRYLQSLFPAFPQHRITGGVSVKDVLPGVDADLFAGGIFPSSETFGVTTVKVQAYYAGAGLTWRFGRGACENLDVADDWCP